MDIIVTTPKSETHTAAAEARACIAAGGGEYFRRFSGYRAPIIRPGDRVWYVLDGYLRGCATVTRVERRAEGVRCDTTGRCWPAGVYVFMDAASWKWIRPVVMLGFQGYHNLKVHRASGGRELFYRRGVTGDYPPEYLDVVGGWLDPMPEVTDG